MRTILFTGKGGVGKTTVSAATALACARAGERTVVMSTDPAHSLADSFDMALDGSLTEVAPNCLATQLDATERMEESWGEIQSYLRSVLNWAGVDQIEAEELSVIPGIEEIFALTDIVNFERSGTVDTLIVDCAPTAETIRLLSLPDVLSWYMDRAFPLGRKLTKTLGPMVGKMTNLPVANDEVFAAVELLYQRFDDVRNILRDPQRSTVRIVVNAEKMVVAEARRTHTYLSLFGYRTDAVVVNKLWPAEVVDPWFAAWKHSQAEQLTEIETGFAPTPILYSYLAPAEVVGVTALKELGRALYGETNPSEVLLHYDPVRVARSGAQYTLTIDLPFATKEALSVTRSPSEVFIRVGPYRRSVLLVDSLKKREVVGARLKNGKLVVRFQ